MKGLLYGNFLLNKAWFIASGILSVLGAMIIVVLHNIFPDSGIDADVLFCCELVVLSVCNEWLGRGFESNLRTRFADYALAGGISKPQFVTSEMLKNLISVCISFLLCLFMLLAACASDRSLLTVNNLTVPLSMALLFGALEWACMPIIISLKSAEKASLVLGLVLGFWVVLPLMMVFNYFDWDEKATFVGRFIDFLADPMSFFSLTAISAAIYAIFYIVLLDRIRKGDVC